MNKADFKKWQVIEDEFLNSDLDEAAFCKSNQTVSKTCFGQELSANPMFLEAEQIS